MKVLFVAGFGPSVREMQTALAFYRDSLGLPIVEGEDVSTKEVDGVKYFSLRPSPMRRSPARPPLRSYAARATGCWSSPRRSHGARRSHGSSAPRVCSSE